MARTFEENTLKPNSKAAPSVRTEGKLLQDVHWNGGRNRDGTCHDYGDGGGYCGVRTQVGSPTSCVSFTLQIEFSILFHNF
jgi:hypothetical protein